MYRQCVHVESPSMPVPSSLWFSFVPSPLMPQEKWKLESKLQVAIQSNDLNAAKWALEQNLDPDTCFGATRTPALSMAAKSGHYHLVRLLIERNCSVNQSDRTGLTALHVACNYLFVEIARLLIQCRANLDATNQNGSTPMHLAASGSSLELVFLLVGSGASLEKRDCNGQTALLMACKRNNGPIVQYLLSKGANVNTMDKHGNTPLLLSIDSGLSINTNLVKLLLNAGADPNQGNKVGSTPLLTTIRRSSEHISDGQETVQALIEHQCDINAHEYQLPYFGESALNLAITRSQDAITDKLIRAGARVEEKSTHDGHSPFVRLVKEGKNDLAKLALATSSGGTCRLEMSALESERAKLAHSDPELFSYLYGEQSCFPKLKHLSRAKFRHWLGSSADRIIPQIQLPYSLRKYLLLGEL